MNKIEIYISDRSTGILVFLLSLLLLGSCSVEKRLSSSISRDFKHSATMRKHQVGFVLYDPVSGRKIYEKNADQYFTPASNAKLFTFYAALKILPDSVPTFRYLEKNDSLIFWGTGDPSFLQSRLKGGRALAFLQSGTKQLFFSSGRYTGAVYGKGWSWDDYNDYYQAEINELPFMDNLVHVKAVSGKLSVRPKAFVDCFLKVDDGLVKEEWGFGRDSAEAVSKNSTFVKDSSSIAKGFKIQRDLSENRFNYSSSAIPLHFEQEIPYKVSTGLTLSLLSDTLKKPIGIVRLPMPATAKTIFNLGRDSLLKAMMQPSDNFIAEQLLLVCADRMGIELNTEKAIKQILKTYLWRLPDSLIWVDGSGLSRNNLFTPRDVAMVLDMIYKEFHDPKQLFALLPAGGQSGTLKNAYPKTNDPYVFGKTGTLSNQYNQSGYVRTKKGKTYIFVFMNNNFSLPTAAVRSEIGRMITKIHDRF